jgi:deazaflavin-dependent oxidoreductase (nitroreductase family)
MALRHVDPTSGRGPLYRLFARVVATRPMGWFSRHIGWNVDPVLMRITRGRLGTGMILPTALLETRGAKTGQVRRNAVIYFHDGDHVVIVASRLGDPRDPGWFHNLRAHPDVRLNDEPFRASVVSDEAERERIWPLADRVFAGYARYRKRAARAGRTVPIVRLERR